MRALIDGDILVFRGACSAINDDQWVALARADKMLHDILEDVGATSYQVYLTGSGNFRRDLTPSYKAHRPDERPQHWQAVRDFFEKEHKAIVCNGWEADDQMGIDQDKIGQTTVICSIDKDLLQIPGRHYNFVKKEAQVVPPEQGRKFLYLQSLIGDKSDNIIGVAGIGPVKAERALAELETEEEWYEKCRELYNDDERYHLNLQLLYIWQKPNDKWELPQASDPTRNVSEDYSPTTTTPQQEQQ